LSRPVVLGGRPSTFESDWLQSGGRCASDKDGSRWLRGQNQSCLPFSRVAPVDRIGILVAVYPAVWGAGHILTGALALITSVDPFGWWATATALLGAGTAMVYPTLLAAIDDVAHPLWRARAVGVFRLSRDSRYADTPARDSLGSTGGRHRQLA
jgi:hypothetical protein